MQDKEGCVYITATALIVMSKAVMDACEKYDSEPDDVIVRFNQDDILNGEFDVYGNTKSN